MMPDYQEIMRRQQQDYQRSRDPFEYGQQVARRRYSEIMAGIDNQMSNVNRSYSDMYQAARQRAVGQRAMGGPTLSGGMGQQRQGFISTGEMQELGRIGAAQNQALRDLYTQGQSAFSNAQLEGQQAAQQELANRQAAFQMVQARQAIMADKNLTEAQRQEQLAALSGGTFTPTPGRPATQATLGGAAAATALSGSVIGGNIALKVGAKQLASVESAAYKAYKASQKAAGKKALSLKAYLKSATGKSAVAKKLGWTGKLAKSLKGLSFWKKAGVIGGKLLGGAKFLFAKALPIYLAVFAVENIVEAAGLNEGKGLLQGDFFEGIGL